MNSIKKTAHIKNELLGKLKLLTGLPVTIGRRYNGISSIGAAADSTEKLTALGCDNSRLLLMNDEQTYFVFLDGDFSAWGSKIVTDGYSSITFNQPITKDTDFADLREKYYKVPKTMLAFIQHCFES